MHIKNKISSIIKIFFILIYIIIIRTFADNECSYFKNKCFSAKLNDLFNLHSAEYYYFLANNNEDSNNDYKQKIKFLSLSAYKNPMDYKSRYELAKLLWLNEHQLSNTLSLLNDALFIYPANDLLHLALGNFYISSNQIKEALKAYKKAADLNNHNLPYIYKKLQHLDYSYIEEITPQTQTGLIYLASFYSSKNEIKKAIELYSKLFYKADTNLKYDIIKKILELKDQNKAYILLEETKANEGKDPEYHLLKAIFYLNNNSPNEFHKELTASTKLAESKFNNDNYTLTNFYIKIADMLYTSKMYNTALIYYNKAILSDFYNATAHEKAARCYFQQGELYKAFTHALRGHENENMLLFIISIFKKAMEKKDETVINEIINYLKDKKSTQAWGIFAKALYYKKRGEYAQAIQCFEKSLNLEPNNLTFLKEAASTNALSYNNSNAIKYFEKYISLQPNDADAIKSLINLYIVEGKVQEARNLCMQTKKTIEIFECNL
jgi:tetratricopeptide (TPR) repeat protein